MTSEERASFVSGKLTKYTLGATDVDTALAEVEQTIKNYCNISVVPVALHFIWCRMAVDLLKYDLESAKTESDAISSFDASDVQTISDGSMSITFGDKYRSNARGRTLMSHQAKLDDVVLDYSAQMNQFRRIY
jgi:hypothetical protein